MAKVPIATTPTALTSPDGLVFTLDNISLGDIYVGGTAVDASAGVGFKIAAGGSIILVRRSLWGLFAVASGPDAVLNYSYEPLPD
ncbi:MAG: hypothetical protein ACYCO5_10280 [Acidobacteriaceae bacterium]